MRYYKVPAGSWVYRYGCVVCSPQICNQHFQTTKAVVFTNADCIINAPRIGIGYNFRLPFAAHPWEWISVDQGDVIITYEDRLDMV